MYKYEIVKIDLSFWSSEPNKNYKEIIESYSKKGWRFVQVFAPAISGYGKAKYFELIFEKEI